MAFDFLQGFLAALPWLTLIGLGIWVWSGAKANPRDHDDYYDDKDD
jgi:hypothetical protein